MTTYRNIFILLLLGAVFFTVSQTQKETPSPADLNAERDVKFVAPPAQIKEFQEDQLKVERYEIQRIGEASDLGKPGDILLTVMGTGFYVTARSPQLLFGKEMMVNNAEANKSGTELYVILPQEMVKQLAENSFEVATVIGGGVPETEAASQLKITPEAFRNLQDLKEARLIYRDSFFLRE